MKRNFFVLFLLPFVRGPVTGSGFNIDEKALTAWEDQLLDVIEPVIGPIIQSEVNRQVARYKEGAGMKGLKVAAYSSMILVSCFAGYFLYYCMR